MLVEDFDIVTILGNTINSPLYKVKNKETHQFFIWHTVDLEAKNEAEIVILEEKIKKRMELDHTHLLKMYNLVKQESAQICYIMTECCENFTSIIRTCTKNNTHLSEELICRILYQIGVFMKTADSVVEPVTLDNIFFDDEFNIKMYNFTLESDSKRPKLSSMGLIAFELCTLQKFNQDYKEELQKVNSIYSSSLISLIEHMVEEDEDILENINKILCHPTVLLKSSQWEEDKCFLTSFNMGLKQDREDTTKSITISMGKLRSKELALRVQKQKLDEWEQRLKKRSKELSIAENAVKEKLQKAELYLKRCRSMKATNSGSNLSEPSSTKVLDNKNTDNLNSTYVSIDTAILPTSKKLNVNEIVKPATFTRTLSEKRIRFKGHSPLKEIDYNKKRNSKLAKSNVVKKPNSWLTCSEETDRSSVDVQKRSKGKQLFLDHDHYEHKNENVIMELRTIDKPCQTTVWTKENQKQAFQLLRLMNSTNTQNKNIRHTHL